MNVLLEYFHKVCISVKKHVFAQCCKEMKEREGGRKRIGEGREQALKYYQIPPHMNGFLLKSSDR